MKRFFTFLILLFGALSGLMAATTFLVAGNGGDDPAGIWCNGINWDPFTEANDMTDTDGDGIYEITYKSVPAGTWNFKVVENGSAWYGASLVDSEKTSANWIKPSEPDGNIGFKLNAPADVTIKYDSNADVNPRISFTTPSGSFAANTYHFFTLLLGGDECLPENNFTEANDNKVTFESEVTSISSGISCKVWANCNYATYERNLWVTGLEVGTYNVTVTFNGDYTNPDFEIVAQKASSAPDVPITPDVDVETGQVIISAIRNRLVINANDFTDFAGLYVSKLPKIEDAEVSYQWQVSADETTWTPYNDGDGATWDNIRPNKAGYYRCLLSYDVDGEVTNYISNVLHVYHNQAETVNFSSQLPVILVRTSKDFPEVNSSVDNDGLAAAKAKRSVDVKILWNKDGGTVTQDDVNNASVLHYDRKARMNYRGSSSLYNNKKSYAFVTGDKNCDAKKLGEVKTKKFGMFDQAANKDWVLYASATDYSYMRNVLSYHQYAQMTDLWGVKCRYVELYIDGIYQGIYVFMDKITQDESRVNINEDTGYIVKFDKTDLVDRYAGTVGTDEDSKRSTFVTNHTGKTNIPTYNLIVDQAFEIDYPEREDVSKFDGNGNLYDDEPWDKKVQGVKAKFEAMEAAILANDYEALADIIDYQSWADWFIINEFTGNYDAYRISCVFTLNSLDDKIVANPIWDYELGWQGGVSGLLVESSNYYRDAFPTPFWWIGYEKENCSGILGDCKFKEVVKERWAKHTGANGALNLTVLQAKMDSLAAVLKTSSIAYEATTNDLYFSALSRTQTLDKIITGWQSCEPETPATAADIWLYGQATNHQFQGKWKFTTNNNDVYYINFAEPTALTGLFYLHGNGQPIVERPNKEPIYAFGVSEITKIEPGVSYTLQPNASNAIGVADIINVTRIEFQLSTGAFKVIGETQEKVFDVNRDYQLYINSNTPMQFNGNGVYKGTYQIPSNASGYSHSFTFADLNGEVLMGSAANLSYDAPNPLYETYNSLYTEHECYAGETFEFTLTFKSDWTASVEATYIPNVADRTYVVRGNGKSDPTGVWCGGIEWTEGNSPVNVMTDADKDGIYEVTYQNVPAGAYSFKVVGPKDGDWKGTNYLDTKNSSEGYAEFDGSRDENISFILNQAADVTIQFNIRTGKIILTTPSGSFGSIEYDYFTVITAGDQCLDENRFTEENNNTVTLVCDVDIPVGEYYNTITYKVWANCSYTVFEKYLSVDVQVAGKYDVTIKFNGDYKDPMFSISAVMQDIDPVIENVKMTPLEDVSLDIFSWSSVTYTLRNAAKATVTIEGDDASAFSVRNQSNYGAQGYADILFFPTEVKTYRATLVITAGNVSKRIDFTAGVKSESAVEEVKQDFIVYANNGTIYSDQSFAIYSITGVEVTHLNGTLKGIYLVKTPKGNQLVSVW